MIANNQNPKPLYVSYAFGQLPGHRLHFYLAANVGEVMHLADDNQPVVSWKRLDASHDASYEGFEISLTGLVSVVSERPLHRKGSEMIDRVREIIYPTPLGEYRILINWAGDM